MYRMSKEKQDKVSFYIRSDFGEKDIIEHRWIVRGDSFGLRHYIIQFMETHEKKRKHFAKLYIPAPKYEAGAFAYA